MTIHEGTTRPEGLDADAAWISKSTFTRFMSVEEENAQLDNVSRKQRNRMGVFVQKLDHEDADHYPEKEEEEWNSFLNIVRAVCTVSGDRLTSQEERTITKRIQSRLKLEDRFIDWKYFNDCPEEDLDYLYIIIQEEVEHFDKVTANIGLAACQDAKREAYRRKDILARLVDEIHALEKSMLDGDSDAEERLYEAKKEKRDAEQRCDEEVARAFQAVDDLKALCLRRTGSV